MSRRKPVRNRGDTLLNALGEPERQPADEFGVLHGNSPGPNPAREGRGKGGGGLSCDFTEFGGGGGSGGDARGVCFYIDPSLFLSRTPYFTLYQIPPIQESYLLNP